MAVDKKAFDIAYTDITHGIKKNPVQFLQNNNADFLKHCLCHFKHTAKFPILIKSYK